MSGYACQCLVMPVSVWLCQSVNGNASQCLAMPVSEWLCQSVSGYANPCLVMPVSEWLCLSVSVLLCFSVSEMPVSECFLFFSVSVYAYQFLKCLLVNYFDWQCLVMLFSVWLKVMLVFAWLCLLSALDFPL